MKSIGVTFQRILQKTAKGNTVQHPTKLYNILDIYIYIYIYMYIYIYIYIFFLKWRKATS